MTIYTALLLFVIIIFFSTAPSVCGQPDSSNSNGSLLAQAQLSSKDGRLSLTLAEIQSVLKKYTERWNADGHRSPLWVIGANPGDRLQIPGVTFGAIHDAKAGMELPISAHLIVINQAMVSESILTTFLHEYGHALYRYSASGEWNQVDSEAEAIRFSLVALDAESLGHLAYREVDAVKKMASQEPYKSALMKLTEDPMWRKYSQFHSLP